MIPRTVSDLDALLDEVTRQSNEVTGLFERLSPEGAAWRPDETRWSAGGHVAHMAIINEAYLGAVTAAGGLVEVNVIEDPKYFVADDVLA